MKRKKLKKKVAMLASKQGAGRENLEVSRISSGGCERTTGAVIDPDKTIEIINLDDTMETTPTDRLPPATDECYFYEDKNPSPLVDFAEDKVVAIPPKGRKKRRAILAKNLKEMNGAAKTPSPMNNLGKRKMSNKRKRKSATLAGLSEMASDAENIPEGKSAADVDPPPGLDDNRTVDTNNISIINLDSDCEEEKGGESKDDPFVVVLSDEDDEEYNAAILSKLPKRWTPRGNNKNPGKKNTHLPVRRWQHAGHSCRMAKPSNRALGRCSGHISGGGGAAAGGARKFAAGGSSNFQQRPAPVPTQPEPVSPEQEAPSNQNLRPIVIDGCNVAFGHGKDTFSSRGLKICVDYFLKLGHKVTAFVPQFRKRHIATTDGDLLDGLEKSGIVVYTPSRRVNGRMVVPYDDRYIVEYAHQTGAVIVSRDTYQDLVQENRQWADTINNRLLMFTWINDTLMFPQDPMGRGGPTLKQLLSFENK